MRYEKKGFTLIELLAVIIILAIIAIIVVPITLNIINDTKISAGQVESDLIYKEILKFCETEEIHEINNYKKICTDGNNIKNNIDEILKNDINLTNFDILYEDDNLLWLQVERNGFKFGLRDGKMVLNARKPEKLIDILMKQYNNNLGGLIKDGESYRYYYRGSNDLVSNNYLWYGGHEWRIIEFDENNRTLKLITQQPLTTIHASKKTWINDDDYELSEINMWLNGIKNNSNGYFYESLPIYVKNNIVKSKFNIGIYDNVSEIQTIKNVGLLDERQFLESGGENSYLNINDWWWLGNRYNDNYLRIARTKITIGNNSPNISLGVRPVINIKDFYINDGDGTLTNSFKLS